MGPTFFFSSTLMALASFRKMALPHSRSRREVNWYHFHFRKAQSASSHSRSVHWTVGEAMWVIKESHNIAYHNLSSKGSRWLGKAKGLAEWTLGPGHTAAGL